MRRETHFEWWHDFWHWSHHANWDSISLFATGAGTLVLALGVGLALLSFRDARKTRDGELVLELSRRWNEPETAESRLAYSKKTPTELANLADTLYPADGPPATPPPPEDVKAFQILVRWPVLIEAIGVLSDHGSISPDAVFKMWGYSIASAWETWQPAVRILRERATYPGTFQYFQAIAEDMQSEARKRKKKLARRDAKQAKKANGPR